jgi:hypothetical protein
MARQRLPFPEPDPTQPGPGDLSTPPAEDSATGLPVLKTWPSVYGFVLCVFVLWVGLLTALTVIYS